MSHRQRDLDDISQQILARAKSRDWKDFDPYDGLAGLEGLIPQRFPLAGRVLIQLLMRSPPGLRPLFGIAPHQEAYTLGLLLSTATLLGNRASIEYGNELVARLLALRLEEGAWGYGFPVVTRAARYGPEDANVIATVFAGLGLIDWSEATGELERVRPAIEDAFKWLTEVAWDAQERTFRYHRSNEEVIYNASILAALFVAESARAFRLDDQGIARQAVDGVVEAQRVDGSWPYGRGSHLDWVDNHHTGFILKALLLMPLNVRPTNWLTVTAEGLSFYLEHLFTEEGRPLASISAEYPADSLAAGQALETLALGAVCLGDPRFQEAGMRTYSWMSSHLRRRDGRYHFRRGRFFPWPGAYLRWGESHIALGCVRLGRSQE